MKMRTLMAMGLLLAMLGCSRLTIENYSQITTGMRYEEVTGLLGEPDACDDMMGMRACRWEDGKRFVNVSFVADKALLFSASNLQ